MSLHFCRSFIPTIFPHHGKAPHCRFSSCSRICLWSSPVMLIAQISSAISRSSDANEPLESPLMFTTSAFPGIIPVRTTVVPSSSKARCFSSVCTKFPSGGFCFAPGQPKACTVVLCPDVHLV